MPDAEHTFGGPWTDVKLDAISDYLKFFTTALKNKPRSDLPFELWYVDAFAGSGERTEQREVGGILEGRPVELEMVQLDGSAKRALAIKPSFKHLFFIEKNERRFNALKQLAQDNPERSIDVRRGDSNAVLADLFSDPHWASPARGRPPRRAVVFLDPYDMGVRWRTLETLAQTRATDVWYLFPLGAVVRQLATNFAAVDEPKQEALDQIFGTADWRGELYREPAQANLFESEVSPAVRTATKTQIESYAKRRLGSVFPFVSDPLPLLTNRGAQLFSLFCASGNPSPIAHALIRRGVNHVLKTYG